MDKCTNPAERAHRFGLPILALIAASDPLVHYDDLIRASAGRRDVSGLGLARIPAESEMQLRYTIEQDCLILTAASETSRSGRP